jgi:hypothetical protein
MKKALIRKADVPNYPQATPFPAKGKRICWYIDGHKGEFEWISQWCLYESLSREWREVCDRDGGMPYRDGQILARTSHNRICLFARKT